MSFIGRTAEIYQTSGASLFLTPRIRLSWLIHFVFYSFLKRILGLFFAILGLILLSPVFLIVAILIKLEDGGPVFFKQRRTGLFGKEFLIYKFRTMVVDNDVRDVSCADKHTKIGKILRSTSIDELPQLLNVLKGDMAFIGPRPWITEYFDTMNSHERTRTLVRPGITGLAQANGRNGISIFDKIGYDTEYVKKYGILMDVRVVFDSVRAVLSKEDADAGKNIIHDEIADLKTENMRYI
ncbi:sugar transferase [Candidatus Saccharibacteria bacterium]|nr:sugar transferase [Candidatus Saccharibacteria bacterium]